MTKLSSREFNQDVGRAKRAALEGPVVITDRGAPAFVLLTFEAYRALSGPNRSILDLLDQNAPADEPFDAPPLDDVSVRRARFS